MPFLELPFEGFLYNTAKSLGGQKQYLSLEQEHTRLLPIVKAKVPLD
jgi:hypothetical protein